jgi:hypothetical protein
MMTTTNRTPSTGAHRNDVRRTDLRMAWVAVASIPVAFILAFIVGEGLYALLGYKPEDATEPLWVLLVAGVPAIVLFLVPCVGAIWYGNRARAQGSHAALLPMVIGAVLGAWMVIMNLVSFLVT